MEHVLNIVDFSTTEFGTVFVKITIHDVDLGKQFEGEVKFMDGQPFGDLIHADRSPLSSECREYVCNRLVSKYKAGEFI
ncbi:hypothetical protein [Metabacillus fastidiosus]|uniref:Uncharacterized protein n=1 Tax=Metabacillus fastidiosus TaxID=1458 RepID=A0ABU6NRW3_9BACI|nr:hypothetical protein [Metabacillus fastidiosus]MED4452247.1 hypothetical protein [Metabacillus fastidiosus]